MAKYSEEKAKILEAADTCGKDSSNLSEYYISALRFSTKLPTVWASSRVSVKEKIPKAIFPAGVLYNYKNQAFRTIKVNEVFYHIASLTSDTGGNEKGQTNTKVDLSYQVGETGFEPATPWSQTRCATGLRYSPGAVLLRFNLAVRAGFEPAIRLNGVCQFSKLVDSASLPPHRFDWPASFRLHVFFLFRDCKDKRKAENNK